MRQRELILLIQSPQPASSKAKIWARAVGLLNMYLITPPYLPSHGKKKKCSVCIREAQSLEERHSLQGCAVTCYRHLENRRGRVCSTRGGGRELGKLPGGGNLYPLFRALPFSFNSVSLGEEKAFPSRHRHLCWGWQVWSSWSLRDTLKKGGQDTRY